jgi:uncharacterized protein YdcH (DUF465 family)
MKTIELLIEDDFYEEFLQTLPKDKVTIRDEVFVNNQKKFRKELDSFYTNEAGFTSYFDNMKEVDTWIKKEYES